MKRIQIISLLFICTFSFNLASAQTLSHKVIKIIDGDTVYVDFNDNGIAEQNEKVESTVLIRLKPKQVLF